MSEPYQPCACEMRVMVCGPDPEPIPCACRGPRPVTNWKGQRGSLVFVEEAPPIDENTPERRLVRLVAGRPEGMTLSEWLAELKALGREVQA